MKGSISIIIPAYNEEKVIKKTVLELHSFLSEQAFDYEIIVVADGPKDGTVEIVRTLENVTLLQNKQNLGKGATVKKGILAATKENILFLDADHAVSIQYLLEFLPLLNQYSIVIGSKYIDNKNQYPIHRKIVGHVFSFLKSILIGLKIKDTQCGFKLFKGEIAKQLFEKSLIAGWCFDVEILLLAKQRNLNIKEMPVVVQNTERASKINIFGSGFQMLRDLIRLRMDFLSGKYAE